MRNAPKLKNFKYLSREDIGIMSKFVNDDIPVMYGHDRYINIDNELFEMNQLDEQTKGLYIWISTYKQLDRECNKIVVPRLTLAWIFHELGVDNPRPRMIKSLKKMLLSLENCNLIKSNIDLEDMNKITVFDIELLQAAKKFEFFTQVYIGNIDAIVAAADGLSTLKYCLTYAVLRSFVTKNKQYTKVITMKRRVISERMNISKSTYYYRLNWLRDHHVIAMFVVQMINDYGNQRVLMSDIRDVKELVTTVDEWKKRKYVSKVLK